MTAARGVPPSPAGKRVLHEPPSRDRPSHCTSQRRTPRPGGRGCRRGKAVREGRLARTPRRAAGARLASRGASLARPEATPAGPAVPVALGGARWLLSRKARVLTESSAKGSSAKCVCLEPFSLLIIVSYNYLAGPDGSSTQRQGKWPPGRPSGEDREFPGWLLASTAGSPSPRLRSLYLPTF